jgi:hypothetical protein
MKLSSIPPLFVLALVFAIPASAQESADFFDSTAPVLTIEQPANVDPLKVFSRQPAAPLPPIAQKTAADTVTEEYRTAIKKLGAQGRQYVHIKLKNGKVLTGLLRDVGEESFSLFTDALGGPSLTYRDLAELPQPVPAVGTRIKQAVEWTGFVAFVVVFFIPLALTGTIPDC